MKSLVIIGLFLALAGTAWAVEGDLSPEEQERIIRDYMFITGQGQPQRGALSTGEEYEHDGYKCGTPAVLEFTQYYERLDPRLLSTLGVESADRPDLSAYFDPPGGNVRIHYETDTSSIHTVYEYDVDDNNDGIPDYVYAVGLAADSAYDFIFNYMGYKAPMPDTACVEGGDLRLDIYLTNLPGIYYGVTYNELECDVSVDVREAAVWIEVENDFANLTEYRNRPLAAARVTLAHEIFHASHFAMDATDDIAWYEMSAVWMEEQQYDEINDYYLLLPIFFADPRISIQSIEGVHHYASVLFPLYLSEVYGPEIIKDIWERAAGYGPGHDFLFSIDRAVDSVSNVICDSSSADTCYTASLASAMRDFSVWSYFTGPYSHQAPEGIGFEERENYDFFPLTSMARHNAYPYFTNFNSNPYRPQYNSSTFIRFENLESLVEEDSLLSVYVLALDTIPGLVWGVTGIYQSRTNPDHHDIVRDTSSQWNFPGGIYLDSILGPIDARKYRTATIVFTPTTPAPALYSPTTFLPLGYAASVESNLIDPLGASVLSPYPNPAVVSEMGGADLTFRFQYPTDTTMATLSETALLLVDLYTVAGEYLGTLEGNYVGDDRIGEHRHGLFEVGWDMRNQAGREVASGVYLAYARLYSDNEKSSLLAEDRVKVAVIR